MTYNNPIVVSTSLKHKTVYVESTKPNDLSRLLHQNIRSTTNGSPSVPSCSHVSMVGGWITQWYPWTTFLPNLGFASLSIQWPKGNHENPPINSLQAGLKPWKHPVFFQLCCSFPNKIMRLVHFSFLPNLRGMFNKAFSGGISDRCIARSEGGPSTAWRDDDARFPLHKNHPRTPCRLLNDMIRTLARCKAVIILR